MARPDDEATADPQPGNQPGTQRDTEPGAAERTLADGKVDQLIREEPLLLRIHDQQLLTMRTPGRDEDLAIGFLLGEGIVRGHAEVRSMVFTPGNAAEQRADELAITLVRDPDARIRGKLARTHEIRSSCGICGIADPQQLLEDFPPLLPGVPRLARAALMQLADRLRERQVLFAATGGCHGALVGSADGTVLGFAEDVGRHNALDKAIGEAARSGHDLGRAIAFLSGRAGFDLVTKCLRARIPVIASVSASSSLAFDLCYAAGATLVGFVRGDRATVYCGSDRLG